MHYGQSGVHYQRTRMLSTNASVDYAYPWWLTYGHVPILVSTLTLLFVGIVRRWRIWTISLIAAVALWSGAAFLVDRFVIVINGRPTLPTERFFASGIGRVLDV